MSKHHGLAHRLYTGEISYDFIKNAKRWYIVSAVIVLICLLGVAVRGLNLSIDFTGGSEFVVPAQVTATSADDYRETVQQIGLPDLGEIKANTVGDSQVRIQVRALTAEEINQVTEVLATKAGVPSQQVTNNLIGASWGQQITQQGLIALVVFLALVSLMIWAYFRNWKMSAAAIIALLHDLLLTIGVYALLQFAFTPATLIGMLTILGYSLYDTVVVFDKVRENTRDITKQKRTFAEASNLAINQVLVRSINTTIIGVLPVAALLMAGVFVLGTGPLKDLGLALFVGMIAGAYSSLFLAAPMYVQMREREPELAAHRRRLSRTEGSTANPQPSEEAAIEAAEPEDDSEESLLSASGTTVDPIRFGSVPGSDLPRQQPQRSTRAERKKDGR
ncbi:MAG TPA: protein translocase subunit SecF [Propioniciclava sp.]|jgi:preprotein translocase subunit SecF|uniref:protein translocase subunit SecF n=1 Tax=Propioniciclava sp. TaxID=2038686 RepID=UPI002C91D905|nr:protein translocase subunit SecF [Propioniciclava sp.]HRL49154.1 protein translocase subunit SecF [Propioniciclava sp.]